MSPPSWPAMNAAMSSSSSHVTPNSGVIFAAVSGEGCTARNAASTLRSNRRSWAPRRGRRRACRRSWGVTGEVVGGEVPLLLASETPPGRCACVAAVSTLSWSAMAGRCGANGEGVRYGLLDRVGPIRPHLRRP